jgi:hypothetical protein
MVKMRIFDETRQDYYEIDPNIDYLYTIMKNIVYDLENMSYNLKYNNVPASVEEMENVVDKLIGILREMEVL